MGNISTEVQKIVEPYAKELNLSIWDIRFEKEGADYFLRIFIDKDEGVSIDDCVDFSHAIDKPLDDADPIDKSYCLEVSSPGVERDLKTPEHFFKMMNRKIKIKTIRPVDNVREFFGTLENFENNQITLKSEDTTRIFEKKETAWVKLDDFDTERGNK